MKSFRFLCPTVAHTMEQTMEHRSQKKSLCPLMEHNLEHSPGHNLEHSLEHSLGLLFKLKETKLKKVIQGVGYHRPPGFCL